MSPVVENDSFTFKQRPRLVPGDLRISWRLSLLLMILLKSRSQKSSLARLYILNDALRSQEAFLRLVGIVEEHQPYARWRMRVEPAIGRILDLMVGEKFLGWTQVAGRMGVMLTQEGLALAKEINGDEGVLKSERGNIARLSGSLPEHVVSEFLKVEK